jgi:hypothetical protein
MKRLQWFIGDRPAEGEENDAEVAHLDAYRERLG